MPGLLDRFWPSPFPGAWAMLVLVAILALSLYGLMSAFLQVTRFVRRMERFQDHPVYTILVLVRNQEQHIEGLVRTLIDMTRGAAPAIIEPELLLVDLGSSDETPLILQRLIRQYEYMRLVQLEGESVPPACDTALFLCRSPVTILIDLRGKVDMQRVIQGMSLVFQKKENDSLVPKPSR